MISTIFCNIAALRGYASRIRSVLFLCFCIGVLGTSAAFSQNITNSSLNGKYFFVQLLVTANSTTGSPSTVSNLGGSITFDGGGAYTYAGSLGTNAASPSNVSGSGSYSIASDGSVTLTNPIRADLSINGRLSSDGKVVIGSTTEDTKDTTGDIFVAIKAPAGGMTNAAITGTYAGSTMAFPGGGIQALSSSVFSLSANGSGQFTSATVTGHQADQFNLNSTQAPSSTSYSIAPDGTGTATFGPATSSSLLNGSKNIFVSADGSYILGFSTGAGTRDIFLATKIFSSSASNTSFNARYWIAELDYDNFQSNLSSASGSFIGLGNQTNLLSERLNGAFSFTAIYSNAIGANSLGQFSNQPESGLINMALGVPIPAGATTMPGAMVGAQVDLPGFKTNYYGIFFAVLAPNFTGTPGAVFLNPNGVVNAADSAPSPNAIAPGDIVALYGSGLSSATDLPSVVPLSASDKGVSVTVNGVAAPLYYISSGQIDIQIPFQTAGSTSATVQVNNNGQQSNIVTIPLAPGDPAIFMYADSTSSYHAAALHANGALVTTANPAKRGETLQVFASGLGVLSPNVLTGAANPSSPPASSLDKFVSILFDGESAANFAGITFAGGAPTFVGLNQINVVVPADATTGPAVPMQIESSWGYSDVANIAIQ